ncbi:hypothetical protein HZB74_03545 [Candidatus Saccharibacteria bacterium]|nr:hypothetical protein [Candidatus Saccharibacteria bacterium]
MLDAYTVRKIAPRLLVAAIGVNLSIYFCVAAIDITNVVGHALANLLVQPFADAQQLDFKLDTGGSTLAGFLLIGSAMTGIVLTALALSGGAVAAIFFTLLPVMLIVLAIIIVVVIRQALLVLLTIFSPIAIVCLVLPGTEKYFKQWWDLFLKTLLVYPIIAALFAVSNIMAIIAFGSSDVSGLSNGASAAQIIGGVVLSFLPLVMVPFAFRFAGGAIGTIMGSTRGLMQGVNRLSGRQRQQALGKGWEKTKSGNFIRTPRNTGIRARANRMAQGAAMIGAGNITPGKFRTAMSDQRFATGAAMMEDSTFKNMMKDDDIIRAGIRTKDHAGAMEWLATNEPTRFAGAHNAAKRQEAADRIMQLKRRHGEDTFKQAGFRALSTNSTAWDDWSDMEEDLHAAAGSDTSLQLDLAAAAIEGQKAAGRMDIGGGSISNFITQADRMRELRANEGTANAGMVMKRDGSGNIVRDANGNAQMMQYSAEKAGDEYMQSVIERNGGATLISGKPKSAVHVAKAYKDRIDMITNSLSSGEKMKFYDPETEGHIERVATERDLKQTLAQVASVHDGIGYVSSEAQKSFADVVMDHQTTLNGVKSSTVGESIRDYRDDGEFQQIRREYSPTEDEKNKAQGQFGAGGGGAPPPVAK